MAFTRIRETRMIARALVQRWPITAEQRQQIIERLMEVVADSGSSNRELIAACKGLLAAEAQNQSDDRHPTIEAGHNRFHEVARRLGIIQHVEGA